MWIFFQHNHTNPTTTLPYPCPPGPVLSHLMATELLGAAGVVGGQGQGFVPTD